MPTVLSLSTFASVVDCVLGAVLHLSFRFVYVCFIKVPRRLNRLSFQYDEECGMWAFVYPHEGLQTHNIGEERPPLHVPLMTISFYLPSDAVYFYGTIISKPRNRGYFLHISGIFKLFLREAQLISRDFLSLDRPFD